MDVIARRGGRRGRGDGALQQRFDQGDNEKVFDWLQAAPCGPHHRLHACLHVAHHRLFIGAPAAGDAGHRQPPGIAGPASQRHLVVGVGEHFAVADQKPHRLPGPAPQQAGRIEALQGRPEAVAALEVALGLAGGPAIGHKAAACPR